MKCAKCQSEMIKAKDSWLCMSCGHLEAISPDSVPLVSKKNNLAKPVSQDLPSPKLKSEEPKADMPTEPMTEKKPEIKTDIPEISASQPAPEPKASLASPANQDMIKTEENSAEIPPQKDETNSKVTAAIVPSVAPSASELHPLQAGIVVSPNESLPIKPKVEALEVAAPEAIKSEPISPIPESSDEIKENGTTAAAIAPVETSTISGDKTVKPVSVQPSEPEPKAIAKSEPEPIKAEPIVVVEAAPTEPVTPKPAAPIPVAEPMPLPKTELPAPVSTLPIPQSAPLPTTLKTVAPETHPASVNTGLIIWIIVALVSFIALVVFGYAYYKGIDLFAGLRK